MMEKSSFKGKGTQKARAARPSTEPLSVLKCTICSRQFLANIGYTFNQPLKSWSSSILMDEHHQ